MIKISEIRKDNGLSQKKLAEMLNISAGNLCDWEKGRIEPNIEALKKISDIFGCTIDYLVGREDDFGNVATGESTLTADEQRLLKAFNSLSDVARRKLIEDAEFYAGNVNVTAPTIKAIKK